MTSKLFTILLFSLISNSLFGQTDSFNTYKNSVLGFKINYDKNWNVLKADDIYNNLDKISLNDSAFNEMIKKNAAIPFFAITKFKEPYDDINPSIKINTKSYGALLGKKLEELYGIMIPQFEKLFNDFKIIEPPKEQILNKTKSVYIKFYYTMKTKEGLEYKTCSEMWMIDRGNYYYLIGAGSKQDESNCSRKEIFEMLNTISLD